MSRSCTRFLHVRARLPVPASRHRPPAPDRCLLAQKGARKKERKALSSEGVCGPMPATVPLRCKRCSNPKKMGCGSAHFQPSHAPHAVCWDSLQLPFGHVAGPDDKVRQFSCANAVYRAIQGVLPLDCLVCVSKRASDMSVHEANSRCRVVAGALNGIGGKLQILNFLAGLTACPCWVGWRWKG